MWWNTLTGRWSWTEQTQYEADEDGRTHHSYGSHVDSTKIQQRTFYVAPAHIYIPLVLLVFVCNLWLVNWGQEAQYCIMAANSCRRVHFEIKPPVCQHLHIFMWVCLNITVELMHHVHIVSVGLSSIFMLSGLIIMLWSIYSPADSNHHTFPLRLEFSKASVNCFIFSSQCICMHNYNYIESVTVNIAFIDFLVLTEVTVISIVIIWHYIA